MAHDSQQHVIVNIHAVLSHIELEAYVEEVEHGDPGLATLFRRAGDTLKACPTRPKLLALWLDGYLGVDADFFDELMQIANREPPRQRSLFLID